MSKNYFELDTQAKKALADKHERPAAFAKSTAPVVIPEIQVQPEPEVDPVPGTYIVPGQEYPLNHE